MQVTHLGSGLDVLGNVPWDPIDAPITSLAARDETEWLTRYTGGWPLLFPNGGDACNVGGIFHGFHGEASIAPWKFSASADTIRLKRRFFSVPVEMERELTVERDLLIVRERLRMDGTGPWRSCGDITRPSARTCWRGRWRSRQALSASPLTSVTIRQPTRLFRDRRATGRRSKESPVRPIFQSRPVRSRRWPTCMISSGGGRRSGGSMAPSPRPCPGMRNGFPVPGYGANSGERWKRRGTDAVR